MGAKARGTVDIRIGGKTYPCRLGFEALCEFEETSGVSAFEALEQIRRSAVRVRVLACAIWSGMLSSAGKDRPSLDAIGEQIMLDGMATAIIPVAELLTASVTSEAEFKRFRKSMEETKEGAPGNDETEAQASASSGQDSSASSSASTTST